MQQTQEKLKIELHRSKNKQDHTSHEDGFCGQV